MTIIVDRFYIVKLVDQCYMEQERNCYFCQKHNCRFCKRSAKRMGFNFENKHMMLLLLDLLLN